MTNYKTNNTKYLFLLIIFTGMIFTGCNRQTDKNNLALNDQGYFEMPGLNVMLGQDYYPEGHQGGVSFIQNGVRVATNGDLRLEEAPGQWSPIPRQAAREVDSINQIISVRMVFPDSSRNGKGFNPIFYPDLYLPYEVSVKAEGKAFRITVKLDKPLPKEWLGKVGFNLELFPGVYFGKRFYMDGESGIFPRQFDSPVDKTGEDKFVAKPMAAGKKLVIAPGDEKLQLTITSNLSDLNMIDGRAEHSNGWFIVNAKAAADKDGNVIDWLVEPSVIKGFVEKPVIHVSQVGYQPSQPKSVVVEKDKNDTKDAAIKLLRVDENGSEHEVFSRQPASWGRFLRYNYLKSDFSSVSEPGIYYFTYGKVHSNLFEISNAVYQQGVWQPVLEYFLPVQMCHMIVKDRYRIWHGLCHMDDARMAPVDSNHFDGYIQGPSTLSPFKSGEHVPGLDAGGWHDAGDFDLRIESQANTVYLLSLAYETFKPDYDVTTIDEQNHQVKMHQPDGIPDVLQQVEHGMLTIMGGYESLGRFYRGIICPSLDQYVMLGDAANMTDNRVYTPSEKKADENIFSAGKADDRWVFTQQNRGHDLTAGIALATASRVIGELNGQMAREALSIAKATWQQYQSTVDADLLRLAVELYNTTKDKQYLTFIENHPDQTVSSFNQIGWRLGSIMNDLGDGAMKNSVKQAARDLGKQIDSLSGLTPFGVPYKPNIWGAGWDIQSNGVKNYFLSTYFPDQISKDYYLHALNFVLGCHPGQNSASFASGVGENSVTVAYGFNRADWSYIPGGVVSGTALIRPDFAELKKWPFFWQQTEYVLGGGSTNFMLLVLAAEKL